MIDPREIPAFWGMCGGMLSGAVGLVTAYSAKAGTPLAQRRAKWMVALGPFAGLIAAEALSSTIEAMVPALDMRAVALIIGWMVANDPRSLFDMLTRVVRAVFNQEPLR